MEEFDIFISYSRKDFSEVNALKQDIEKNIEGVKCWIDINGIESGEEFEKIIVSAIDNSKILLLAISDNCMASEWTAKEWAYAEAIGKSIIPVLLKGAQLKGTYQFHFGTKDCIAIDNPLQSKKMLKNISSKIGKPLMGDETVETPPTPPADPPIIKSFGYPADADMHEGSEFPISWEVENCTKVQLKFGRSKPIDVAPQGQHPFKVRLDSCTIVLTAWNGTSKAEKKITVKKEKSMLQKASSWMYRKTKKILK